MSAFPYQGSLCCFCFNLKTGSKLIAFATWLVCTVQLFSNLLLEMHIETQLVLCYDNQGRGESVEGILVDNCLQHSLWLVRSMLIFNSLWHMWGFIGSLLLLRGINQRNPGVFYVWFLYCFTAIGVSLMHFGSLSNPKDGYSNLLLCLTLFYFFLVVRVYQRKLKLENEGTLPVISSTRVDDFTLPTGGISSVVCCRPGQPKDTAPPPYSSVSPPPPPYSTVSPLGMGILTGTHLSAETQTLEQSTELRVQPTEPPPSYEEANKNSDRSDELTVTIPTEGTIEAPSDVVPSVNGPK